VGLKKESEKVNVPFGFLSHSIAASMEGKRLFTIIKLFLV
jgi:hypothetical protein